VELPLLLPGDFVRDFGFVCGAEHTAPEVKAASHCEAPLN